MKLKEPNRDEKQVIDCLKMQGYKDIVFEPDGNIPPDILIDGSIAIEVRRLNQNIEVEDGIEGLEQKEYHMRGLLSRVMKEFRLEEGSKGAFVGYRFSRPLPPKKELMKLIYEVFEKHKECIREKKKYQVTENLVLDFIPSNQKASSLYRFGYSSDNDSGGFVIGLLHENLKWVIHEKQNKIDKYRLKYGEWWLALVDVIGNSLDDYDYKQFYELPKLEYDFDRILLVSSLDFKRWRYLYE